MYENEEFCFVCSRATDHVGEHDDLVYDFGVAAYDRNQVIVIDYLKLDKLRES